jgi:hypothetical protein
MAQSTKDLCVILSINDTQHNDTQHKGLICDTEQSNDTKHK